MPPSVIVIRVRGFFIRHGGQLLEGKPQTFHTAASTGVVRSVLSGGVDDLLSGGGASVVLEDEKVLAVGSIPEPDVGEDWHGSVGYTTLATVRGSRSGL